ncbi:ABC transporter [Marinitoga sp. 1135]|uniref:ABC-type multidrug transport system, ATPase component n=1 Tax=Marinitoga piezophila (strain DSM 14283 / JCM 11233 / KA3) TaxID=443254 RepID=H2J7E3_MARPK|nr:MULTISPECIES: ABC transporter ATP-binding protein [Marinitoga]AEX85335.1 ABC-type multidrug transport system, ATPase component [Marinitoga piezophila KA3]APT75817.1 ABC transporter [Marinitoga sp. 1137]NUU95549.1 ABC transporter [Marinitoga sp. 1135]NUU97476.1 ABC transporter [Marinitoga sp. 1138]
MEIIKFKGVKKRYYSGTEALKDIHFSVKRGEIIGIIGPNGAGKTTLIKLILGLLKPTEGEIEIFGKNIKNIKKLERNKIGMVLDTPGLYDDLTIEENIKFWQKVYKKNNNEIWNLIDRWKLTEKKKTLIKNLSAGMRQKVAILNSLSHDPELVIMDEPTSNLDPEARRDIVDFLKGFKGTDKSLIITSHDLFDIERICTRIIFLRKGKVIVDGTLKEMKKALKIEDKVKIIVSQKIPERIIRENNINLSDEKTTIIPEEKLDKILEIFRKEGIDVKRIEDEKTTLEDMYISIVREDEENVGYN